MPAFPWGYLEESEEYLEAERKSENPDFVKIAEIVKEIEEILDDKKNPKILWEFIAEDLQRHTWGHEYLKLGLKKGAIQWCRDIGKDPFRLLSPGQDGKAPTTWEVEFRFLQEHVKCHKYLALVDLEQMEPTLCTKYISRFRVHKVQMPTVAPDCQKCKSSHTDTIYR